MSDIEVALKDLLERVFNYISYLRFYYIWKNL